jgi:hypothetical protein
MLVTYRHTQFGYVMVGSLGAGVVGMSVAVLAADGPHALGAAIALLALCLVLFPTLTTEVQSERVRCYFGLGVTRRNIELREVVSASVVRNHWLQGWGVRLIPGGWMWNVSGLDAVELRQRSGKLFRIGTDEPEKLCRAILSAVGAV